MTWGAVNVSLPSPDSIIKEQNQNSLRLAFRQVPIALVELSLSAEAESFTGIAPPMQAFV
jgi:hypothetical protein